MLLRSLLHQLRLVVLLLVSLLLGGIASDLVGQHIQRGRSGSIETTQLPLVELDQLVQK